MPDQKYTYFVSGRLYARVIGSAAGFEWPGLVDVVTLNATENVIQLADRTSPGGGNYDELRRIESVGLNLQHREFRPQTLADAISGESTPVQGAPVTNDAHEVTLGRFIPLNHPGPYTDLTVTDDDSAPNPVAAEGNYRVVVGGLMIDEDAEDLADEDVILVNYTHPAYSRVQAFTRSPPELEIFFSGVNEARQDKEVRVHMHRVRLGAPEEIALLSGDEFGALSLNGEVMKDLTKVGSGISQYFYEDIVK